MDYVTESDWIVKQSEWFYLLATAFFTFFAGVIVGVFITWAGLRNTEPLSQQQKKNIFKGTSMYLCKEHGGIGFMSDCTACRDISYSRNR